MNPLPLTAPHRGGGGACHGLCGVALNAYLAMLLDTGVLHCDPHPGNLLRMDDGRLCILDWGRVGPLWGLLQYDPSGRFRQQVQKDVHPNAACPDG